MSVAGTGADYSWELRATVRTEVDDGLVGELCAAVGAEISRFIGEFCAAAVAKLLFICWL